MTITTAATHHTWSQHGGSMALYSHYHTHIATKVRTAATSSLAHAGIADVVHPNPETLFGFVVQEVSATVVLFFNPSATVISKSQHFQGPYVHAVILPLLR